MENVASNAIKFIRIFDVDGNLLASLGIYKDTMSWNETIALSVLLLYFFEPSKPEIDATSSGFVTVT